MANKKKQNLHRRAYRATNSFFRYWRSLPPPNIRTAAPFKILTNTQDAAVAGISRVISSFTGYAQVATSARKIEIIGTSIKLEEDFKSEPLTWQRSVDPKTGAVSLASTAHIPSFGEATRKSKNVEDVRRIYAPLTKLYQEQLKEERPDVVLVNGTYVMPWCLMMAARAMQIPVVLYYHGSLIKETEHWTDMTTRRMLRHIEESFDRADIKYVFPSSLIKNYVEKHVFKHTILRKQKIVLPNPIPDVFFKTKLPPQKKGVAFVGRWTRIKNTTFVDRFVSLNYKKGNPLDIVIVTDSGGKRKASKILHDKVTFAGPFHTPAAMAAFYSQMEVVLCPSHFETYGNVAQEAVAAGTPALVSSNMGVAEVLKKIHLENLITSFKSPRHVFDDICNGTIAPLDSHKRKLLQEVAGDKTVHSQLLQFLMS